MGKERKEQGGVRKSKGKEMRRGVKIEEKGKGRGRGRGKGIQNKGEKQQRKVCSRKQAGHLS